MFERSKYCDEESRRISQDTPVQSLQFQAEKIIATIGATATTIVMIIQSETTLHQEWTTMIVTTAIATATAIIMMSSNIPVDPLGLLEEPITDTEDRREDDQDQEQAEEEVLGFFSSNTKKNNKNADR